MERAQLYLSGWMKLTTLSILAVLAHFFQNPGNYRGITLLNVVSKLYSRVINKLLLKYLELNHMLHEGQGLFRS